MNIMSRREIVCVCDSVTVSEMSPARDNFSNEIFCRKMCICANFELEIPFVIRVHIVCRCCINLLQTILYILINEDLVTFSILIRAVCK